ncbi:Branched-chain amino acid transport system carrier protein [hydrothermal vent metagenome]|uniref:Branched-chain amino acid transport system carrier protein n=1 Tax=hydrothermal vent metagenome TaxID=652676 RepID=A0A3B0TXD8_9ZZZZ
MFSFNFDFGEVVFSNPFGKGILEGYQTFDAIGSIVVGGVIITSINLKNMNASYEEKKVLIRRVGWIAGPGLFLIYAGLIVTCALMHDQFAADISRAALLNGISLQTLGGTANIFLSILVSLACFTTAVGIVTGTSDYVKHRFNDSKQAYLITAIIGCVMGVVMGQFDVHYIIAVAVPALMFIYPITIVLILLNIAPDKFASPKIFKAVVFTTIIFSIPDFLGSITSTPLSTNLGLKGGVFDWLPLHEFHMGWVLPVDIVFLIANILTRTKRDIVS